MAPTVSLRPATLADLDAFEQRFDSAEASGPYQWFGHTSLRPLREMWEERRLLRGPHNLLAVEADGELAGRVDYFEKSWGRPDTSTCWEIAIDLENAAELAAVERVGFRALARPDLLSLLRDEWAASGE